MNGPMTLTYVQGSKLFEKYMLDTKEGNIVVELDITTPPETYTIFKIQISPKGLEDISFEEFIDCLLLVLTLRNKNIPECFNFSQCRH
ncbi:hypothetical protein PR048_013881 [Dryococelus australis]|uniref:Uncharacterized protein n=1 Tax=Dryococelus australis TaxID=614101 RepID=A0ABQ9HV02_9NEOP|nr:hypothetical protein PR048_013881 [Dryococelus australis]